MIDGEQVSGALNIFNQLLMSSNPDMDVAGVRQHAFNTRNASVYGLYLPAACFAMYRDSTAKKISRRLKGMLLAAGLT